MRHGKAWRYHARLNPHFLFLLRKRKRPFMVKRKDAEGRFDTSVSNYPKRGLAATHCRLSPQLSYRLRRKSPNDLSTSPASAGMAFIWLQRGHHLLLFPLPLPLSLEGFPKGRNRSFAPLCRFKGVRGEIEIPPRFSLGDRGGHSLFKREYPLGFSVPKRYSSAGNSGPMWEHHITPARRTAPRCCCPLSLRQ